MLADDEYFLLTYWGTLVCFDSQRSILTHRDPREQSTKQSLAGFSHGNFALRSIQAPSESFEVIRTAEAEPVCLRQQGLFLCASDDGNLEPSRSVASDWEHFLVLSRYQLDALLFLLIHDWIEKDSGTLLHRAHSRIIPGFRLRLETFEVILLENIPISLIKGAWSNGCNKALLGFRSCVLWIDTWKPVQLILFRPLVFYCVFGRQALAQLAESVRSLKEIGNYGGDLLILTDIGRLELEQYTYQWSPTNLHMVTIRAYDKLDFCSARYRIVDWDLSSQFQPFLYVDTDVAFDLNPERMLMKVATSSKIAVQRELGHPLSTHGPVGANLLRAAGVVVGEEDGFNSGVIGIPNIPDHATTLMQIRETLYRYISTLDDRRALTHFDQPVANFIGYLTQTFDSEIITPCIRWMHTNGIHGGLRRVGLVHFWGAVDKADDLRRYIDSLLVGHLPPVKKTEDSTHQPDMWE